VGFGFGGTAGEVEGGSDFDCGVLHCPVILLFAACQLGFEYRYVLERSGLVVGYQAVVSDQVADSIAADRRPVSILARAAASSGPGVAVSSHSRDGRQVVIGSSTVANIHSIVSTNPDKKQRVDSSAITRTDVNAALGG